MQFIMQQTTTPLDVWWVHMCTFKALQVTSCREQRQYGDQETQTVM